MKTILNETGDTFIRPSNHWADRAAPIMFACFLLFLLVSKFSLVDDVSDSGQTPPRLWLFFLLWLILFSSVCARIAWSFFGVTKISVSSDDLVVRHCIGERAIYTSSPIKLSAIKDVFIDEIEVYLKGTKWHRWVLVVCLEDGSTHRVVKFPSDLDANEFMSRYVR